MPIINPAKIYSTLGNPNSLVPLMLKDMSSTAGMTASSFVTGKEEGQDRFIDEIGTQIIWLCGIPAFKWIFDKTVFKILKLDSKFDVRNVKNNDIFQKTKEYAPDDAVKKEIELIEKNKKTFTNAVKAKFLVSTGLTIAAYIGLTHFKQKYTEKQIRQNLIDEYNKTKEQNEQSGKDGKNQVSFKGSKVLEYFAYSPVKNMYILDGAITGERLKDSRSKQEFIGYTIKEGSTLCFMYYAGARIQKAIEKHVLKKHNKSIELDARVIESADLQKVFEDGSIENSLKMFDSIKSSGNKKDAVALYDFIHKNPENMIVKVAKQSDIIQMYNKTDKIDTRKYIDLEEVENLNTKIKTLYEQYKNAIKNGETTDVFFKKIKKLKRNSILINIGSCIFALGILTPAIMLIKRFTVKNDEEFQTKKEIREQLIKEGVIK